MPDTLLISLHLPKTAGTSVRTAMRAHFGTALVEDYDVPPMQVRRGRRELSALASAVRTRRKIGPGIAAVHGHFLPVKYRVGLYPRAMRYVTWLRDPVERVVSHYHYWLRDYAGQDPAQPLRNRVVRERWSLERFCLGPEMRNLYQQYLWAFDPRRFDFIGITERYDADFARFADAYLGGDSMAAAALVNPDREGDRYVIAPDLRARIVRHHAADVALYAWAFARGSQGEGRKAAPALA